MGRRFRCTGRASPGYRTRPAPANTLARITRDGPKVHTANISLPSSNPCNLCNLWLKKISSLNRPNQEDRQLARAVRAENENPFDVAGSTGTGNEGGKTGIVIAVLRVEKFEGRWQIRQ
jgi:hypothetical protein